MMNGLSHVIVVYLNRDNRYCKETDKSDGENNLEYVLFVVLLDEVAKWQVFLFLEPPR